MREKYWNRAVIAGEIMTLRETGADLSWTAVRREHTALLRAATRQFGGWREAVEFAGIDYESVRRVRIWDPERVRLAITALHEAGVDLSLSRMLGNKERSCVLHAARCHFGTWKEAVEATGLNYDEISRQKSWSAEDIGEAIRSLHGQGEDLSSGSMDESYVKLISAARRRFGSWDKALEYAGLDCDAIHKRRRWNRDKIIEGIKRLSEENGNISSTVAARLDPGLYTAAQRKQYFGGWGKALQAATGLTADLIQQPHGPAGER